MAILPIQPAPSTLDIRLLGPLQVEVEGQSLPRLHSRKGGYLLALLALRNSHPIERAFLSGTLWPDSEESQALFNLRQCLSNLRLTLGGQAHRLASPTPRTLCLDTAGAWVDVVEFDQAVTRGDTASLEQAVALYRGPLLEGCLEEWVFPERLTREQAYLSALERLAEQALAGGKPGIAGEYLRRAILVDPLRESLQRTLMQALAAAGDYAAATQVYRTLRLLLHQEMHTQPDATTQTLFQQMRTQAQRSPGITPASVTGTAAQPSLGEITALPSGTVTFLLTDIEGSTRLWEEHAEAMRQALARYEALATSIVETHQGRLIKSRGEGDSLFCVFARASDAVSCACALQQAFQEEAWPEETPLKVRLALHTGEADLRDGDYYGSTVNRCARLRALAQGGQVLVSQATQDLVADILLEGSRLKSLGQHRLRDLSRPEQIFQLLHPALPADFPPLKSLGVLPTNLPVQLTSFIGREKEIAQVKGLLAGTHLLTLTGSGGCGKTRLGLQVAADLIEAYPDGVWLVELAALSDPTLVPQALASVLELREEPGRSLSETVKAYLLPKSALLVLDNCEHLHAACAHLTHTLLTACPQVRILATSREALGCTGEQNFRVPSLLSPDPKQLPTQEKDLPAVVGEYEAVRLFVERARLQKPEFVLTEENAPAVALICHRVDGIPLAIELAAARIRSLTPTQIAARLNHFFRFLTGGNRSLLPRQQTLRATLDWSYDLLSEQERRLLGRASVFAGGWALEAAEAVCAGQSIEEWEVLDLLTSLVDKSLVVYGEQAGKAGGRYWLLETVHHYARERLTETQEETLLRRQHLDFFLTLAEAAAPNLEGSEQSVWLEGLEVEHDNFRSALGWCAEAEVETEAGLRLVGALVKFWEVRGYLSEGREYAADAIGRAKLEGGTQAQAKALHGAGVLAASQGDYGTAHTLCEESLSIFRELGNKQGIALSLGNLGNMAYNQGDYATARALHEESLALRRELEDKQGIAYALNGLGNVAFGQSNLSLARSLYQESLSVFRELGNRRGIAHVLGSLGAVAYNQGDYATARALHEESLAIQRVLGDKLGLANLLNNLGGLFFEQGDYGAARTFYEESLALRRELGDKRGIGYSLLNVGNAAYSQGENPTASVLLEESLSVFREMGNKRGLAHALSSLGEVAINQGNYSATGEYFQESLALRWELGDKQGTASSLESFARLAVLKKQPQRAGRLWGSAEALREALGIPLPSDMREEYDRKLAEARTALGEGAFAAVWVEGRGLSMEQAVAYALEKSHGA